MSQRDWPALSGAVAIPQLPAPTAAGPRAYSESAARRAPIWEEHFSSLPQSDQQHLLALAADQGFLFEQQIPAAPAAAAHTFENLVNGIQAGHDLPPSSFVEPIEPLDSDLDGPQRDAVARSLHNRDLLLIQGLPGTGKTRLIAEILGQCAQRGERVLFTASSSAAVDAALIRLGPSAAAGGVRVLAETEPSETLVPEIRAMTWQRRLEIQCSNWFRQARDREEHTEQNWQAAVATMPSWPLLEQLSDQCRALDEERLLLQRCRQNVGDEVRRDAQSVEPVPNSSAFADRLRRLEQALAEREAQFENERVELQKQQQQCEQLRTEACGRRDALQHLIDAAASGRFWSANYWKGRLNKALPDQLIEAQAEVDRASETLRNLYEREQQRQNDHARGVAGGASERERLIEEEIKRRMDEFDLRLEALTQLGNQIGQQFQSLCASLGTHFDVPASTARDDVRQAHEMADAELRQRERRFTLARRWRELLENNRELIVERLREATQFVAGPIGAFASEATWGAHPAKASGAFDLLVIDEAHLATERDLLAAARLARRWVLVGEPALTAAPLARTRTNGGKPLRNSGPAPSLFARLWDQLHHETWIKEADRLCCRLHSVAAADRRKLEKESVADRADIELRILNTGTGQPILAEVLFPSSMCLAEAKEYLFRELGEIPCLSGIRTAQWLELPEGLHFRLTPNPAAPMPSRSISLDAGIAMRAHDSSPCLSHSEIALTFSNQEGWDRERAQAWVHRHLLTRDPGRTCKLQATYRHLPALASWLNEAIGCRYPVADERLEGSVQFEQIPRRTPVGQRRGGAGLEIDLADAQQRELLPVDLAGRLPKTGYVNLPEAQAIAELVGRLPIGSSFAVTAAYPSQISLLRLLCPERARVVSPAELAHSECDILVIGLTRSHVTRAVTYGDDPAAMPRTLTRARRRLIVVGDPGTLSRRAQWEGAVDRFDEAASERERRWVNALLRCLPPRPSHVSRIPEGARV